MLVPALVLIVAALAVGVVGVLALVHKLPRNRVLGVRTTWTMSSVDAFRRANGGAAPAFVAAGAVGLVAGVAATVTVSPAAGVTLLVVGVLGLVGLVGVAGVTGARYAEADEADVRRQPVLGACNAAAPGETDEAPPGAGDECGAAEHGTRGAAACAGTCSLCPRGVTTTATAGD